MSRCDPKPLGLSSANTERSEDQSVAPMKSFGALVSSYVFRLSSQVANVPGLPIVVASAPNAIDEGFAMKWRA